MYKVLLDDSVLYYPGDDQCVISDAILKLKISQAGSFECVVPDVNPLWGSISLRKSMITVYKDNTEIFCGEVREVRKDAQNRKHIYAVGELAFLMDSIQPQYAYGAMSPTLFLDAVLAVHNGQVEARKQFTRGTVNVPVGFDASAKVTDWDDTLSAIRSQLINVLGGALRVRKVNGTRYLDYVTLESYGSANTQGINFGENLLDYTEDITASDIVTVVIPLGARLKDDGGFEKRVTIETVNANKNYITASNSVLNTFGRVWKTVTFDGIESPATLKSAGQQWLTENQFENATFTLSAVDLSNMDASIDDMRLGDRIPCYAPPFGLDATIPIQEMKINLQDPGKDVISLGMALKNRRMTVSSQAGNIGNDIRQAVHKKEMVIREVIETEVSNIMEQFTGAGGGYKLSEYDENGLWLRDLYMDAPLKTQATNVMEISMAGIRFSTSGYQPANSSAWTSAWTIGGAFCADFITTGTLLASVIKAGTLSDAGNNMSWNLETGALTAKRLSVDSTYFKLQADGTLQATKATLKGGLSAGHPGTGNGLVIDAEDGAVKGYRLGRRSCYMDFSNSVSNVPGMKIGGATLSLCGKIYTSTQEDPLGVQETYTGTLTLDGNQYTFINGMLCSY